MSNQSTIVINSKTDTPMTKSNKLLDIEKPITDEKYIVNIPRRSSKPLNVKMYDS